MAEKTQTFEEWWERWKHLLKCNMATGCVMFDAACNVKVAALEERIRVLEEYLRAATVAVDKFVEDDGTESAKLQARIDRVKGLAEKLQADAVMAITGMSPGDVMRNVAEDILAALDGEPRMGSGDYSCVTCGMGMKEPCEHWKAIMAEPKKGGVDG